MQHWIYIKIGKNDFFEVQISKNNLFWFCYQRSRCQRAMKNLGISNFFPFIFLQSFLFKTNNPVIRLTTVFIVLEKKFVN